MKRFPGQADVTLRPSATLANDAQAFLARAMQSALGLPALRSPNQRSKIFFIEKVQETSPADAVDLSLNNLEPVGSYLDA